MGLQMQIDIQPTFGGLIHQIMRQEDLGRVLVTISSLRS